MYAFLSTMQTPNPAISLHVSVTAQALEVRDPHGEILRRYPISTSRFGLGTEPGSRHTPLGLFRVGEMIGEGEPVGMTFRNRLPTGELGLGASDDDLILTRILWLEGAEPHNANTRGRYIYIHGTNHEARIGEPMSHGCVRMRNADVIELFGQVSPGTEVRIAAT